MNPSFQTPPGLAVVTLVQKGLGPGLPHRAACHWAVARLRIDDRLRRTLDCRRSAHGALRAFCDARRGGRRFGRKLRPVPCRGPGMATILLADDDALTWAVDRAWKLAMS